jgi:hypothetical protein
LAIRLDSLKEGGARFDYPNALSPYEWALIEALQMARRKDGAADQREKITEARAKVESVDASAWYQRATGK